MVQARFLQGGDAIDHTPSSDVAAGDVIVQGNLVAVAKRDIPANTLGAIHPKGVFDVAKANEALSTGDLAYWDADGDPVNGTAGSGATTATSSGNTLMGKVVKDAAAGDETVQVRFNQ